MSQVSPAVRQADPAAYYYAGLRIAEVGSPTFCDDKNVAVGPYFTMLGFTVRRHNADPCFYSKYSIGLPLLIALTRLLALAPEAVPYVMPLLGLVGVVAVFALGQILFDRRAGLLAAGLLAFNFRYWYGSTEIWSDVPALAFLLVGAVFVVRMIDQDHLLLGLLGGTTFAYACLIRYPLVIVLLPLGLYFLSATRAPCRPMRAFLGFASGFVGLAMAILAYNKLIYGGFLTTGYSSEHGFVPWPAFSLSHFFGQSPIDAGTGYRAVLSTLVANFHVLGLLLALVGLAIMPRAKAVLIGSWAVIFCAPYAFYFRSVTGVNARLLLPAFPMICLAIGFAAIRILRLLLGRRELVLVGIIPLLIATWHLPAIRTSLVKLDRRNGRNEARVALVRKFTEMTEGNAVFLSREYQSHIILYGQRSVLHYSMIATPDPASQSYEISGYEAKLVELVNELLENGLPVYVVVEPEDRVFRQGPIDPYPILSAHFQMVPVWSQPEMLQVRLS